MSGRKGTTKKVKFGVAFGQLATEIQKFKGEVELLKRSEEQKTDAPFQKTHG